ncbi:hypothetical protein ABVT39_012548 [Epinephelus coioides]
MMQRKRSYEKWTDNEVKAVFSVFAAEEIQQDFKPATQNDRVYGRIAHKLVELNIAHTPKQIREKLKKFKQMMMQACWSLVWPSACSYCHPLDWRCSAASFTTAPYIISLI